MAIFRGLVQARGKKIGELLARMSLVYSGFCRFDAVSRGFENKLHWYFVLAPSARRSLVMERRLSFMAVIRGFSGFCSKPFSLG